MRLRTTLLVSQPPKRPAWQPPLSVEIASGSVPGLFWTCTRLADGTWTCNCPDHVYRGRVCKHIPLARVKCGEVDDIDPGDLL